jgi:UDP-N-acetylmuramoyl-L-alanyl-D-glutamate--2,6-diaminopimelate ligase
MRCVLTSDNPRNEDPVQIIADIQAGLQTARTAAAGGNRSCSVPSLQRLQSAAQADDVVLIAGKGHESLSGDCGCSVIHTATNSRCRRVCRRPQ